MHLAGRDFPMKRANALSVAGWRPLFEQVAPRADEVEPGLAPSSRPNSTLEGGTGRSDLPVGVIHADLFPDNVFFLGERLSGLIDFYFACNDMLAYDLAICLNAWCFEPDGAFNVTKARALLSGLRPRAPIVRGRDRGAAAARARLRAALPADPAVRLAQRAAGALVRPKDPLEYPASCASTGASPACAPTGSGLGPAA